jgi:hypothetical protein
MTAYESIKNETKGILEKPKRTVKRKREEGIG